MTADISPKISVIIPVYEAEVYLGPCIDSVLAQTYQNFELLLIDDGSKDRSGSLCDEYARTDSRIAVYHRKNQGVSQARNFGLQQASGDYILFIDADDLIKPDYIEKLYHTIPHGEENVISLCRLQFLRDGVYSDRQEALSDFDQAQNSLYTRYLEPLITGKIQGACWRVLYPAGLLRNHQITFHSCKIAEDQLFFLEVISHCRQIRVCEEALYIYRLLPQSSSHRAYISDYLPDRIAFLDALNKILSRISLEQAQRQWLLSYSFQFYRMLLYMNATASENSARELAQIDASPFGTRQVSKPMQKKFSSMIGKKHKFLNFLVVHRLFPMIRLLRMLKRGH